MGTKEILTAIKKLPVSERILIVEKTLKNIRKAALKKNLESAADCFQVRSLSETRFSKKDWQN